MNKDEDLSLSEGGYNHEAETTEEAVGLDMNELNAKYNKVFSEARPKTGSEIVQLLEKNFTPKELGMMVFSSQQAIHAVNEGAQLVPPETDVEPKT